MNPDEPHAPPAGPRVGVVIDDKYTLVRLIGRGGMGEVYEGRHNKIGRRVAVKFLAAEQAQHPDGARRFENEARAAGSIEHENIAAVFDVSVLSDGTPYLVMEFLDGQDLNGVLQRELRLPLVRAADILVQTCRGLDVVHRKGIVHRDLKPGNLFLVRRATGGELVKILDFGIAKLLGPQWSAEATKTGSRLGTVYYMSPEQARGERDVGAKSDIYALGVILYEMLSGQRPHDGDSILQILHRILTQPPKPLEEVCPGLPPAIYATVRKAMAPKAEDRFQHVGELAAELAPFASSAMPGQPPGNDTRSETVAPRATSHEPRSPVVSPVVVVTGDRLDPAPAAASVVRTGGPARSGWGLRRAIVGLGLAMGVVAAGATIFTLTRERAAPERGVPSAAALGVASPHVEAPPEEPSAVPRVPLPGSVSAPAVSGHSELSGRSTDAAPASARADSSARAPGPPVAKTAVRPAPASPVSSASKPNCKQKYTLDSEGNKHFRPECF